MVFLLEELLGTRTREAVRPISAANQAAGGVAAGFTPSAPWALVNPVRHHLSGFVPVCCPIVQFPMVLVFYLLTVTVTMLGSAMIIRVTAIAVRVFILLLLNYQVSPATFFKLAWVNDPFHFSVFCSTLRPIVSLI